MAPDCEAFEMKLLQFVLVPMVVFLAAGYGWMTNIIAIVNSVQLTQTFDYMLILRFIGIPLFPLGVVLGYI